MPFDDDHTPDEPRAKASKAALAALKKRGPPRAAAIASAFGFGGWDGGLFFTTDPTAFDDVLAEWLDAPGDACVFARCAFGELFLWKDGAAHYLNVHRGTTTKIVSSGDVFFDGFLSDANIADKVLKKPLHAKARQAHGVLGPDEVYAFEPALSLGGSMDGGSVRKVALREHLSLLAGLRG